MTSLGVSEYMVYLNHYSSHQLLQMVQYKFISDEQYYKLVEMRASTDPEMRILGLKTVNGLYKQYKYDSTRTTHD